ncbi:MAG: gamma-glutamylcyclotransferase [Thermoanaerobaculia bacterium]
MEDFLDSDLGRLERVNRLRSAGAGAEHEEVEAALESRFRASVRLAVYGSLAPGRSNHDQVAELAGEWTSGLSVRGELRELGWGVHYGFPALRWSMSGGEVPVQLFVSEDLPRHWSRLDQFEGSDYVRILVPVLKDGEVETVANLYEARER